MRMVTPTEQIINNEILSRITYKRDWKMEVTEDTRDIFFLEISRPVQDVYYEGNRTITLIQKNHLCSLGRGRVKDVLNQKSHALDDFFNEVREHIIRFELHEMDEWLKLDGMNMRQPHPENQT